MRLDDDFAEPSRLKGAAYVSGVCEAEGLSSTVDWISAAQSGSRSNSFSWRERQQLNASAPDGLRILRKLPKAATGSLKVITPNSREHGIRTLSRQVQGLSVCLDQPHLAERLGPPFGDLKEQRGQVHPDHLPFSSNPLGELEKGLPSSATDIENNVPRTQTQGRDGPQPQGRKLKIN